MLFHLVAALLLLTESDACDNAVYLLPAVGEAVAARVEAADLKTPGSGPVYTYQLSLLRDYHRAMPLCPTFQEGDAVRRAAWLVQGQRELGDDFRRHCARMAAVEPCRAARWEALRLESGQACAVWELLADSLEDGSWRYNAYQPARRRLALRDLKAALGPEAFAAGVMPPPVPYWHFSRIGD